MVIFPNCKINLGLKILRKREDGYHDLETVFYPLPLKDALEVIRADQLQFTATGIPVPGDPAANLCIKAYHLLKNDFPDLPPADIHLHKHIPMGAGLGGGSSDGAAMLLLLNKQFHLQLDTPTLLRYAARLGSDCPFFIINKPCWGRGRGEQLQPVELDLSAYSIIVVHPDIHISTAQAFSLCRPDAGGQSVRTILSQDIRSWATDLVNDFEEPVFSLYPTLGTLKRQLYDAGAWYASLTGSGSSLFGIFEKDGTPDTRAFAEKIVFCG